MAGNEYALYAWNTRTGKRERVYGYCGGSWWCMVPLPDGRLATGSRDGTVCIVDAECHVRALSERHSDWVTCMLVLPDGRLATGSRDQTTRVWNTAPGACELVLAGHAKCMAVLPNGRLAVGGDDKKVNGLRGYRQNGIRVA